MKFVDCMSSDFEPFTSSRCGETFRSGITSSHSPRSGLVKSSFDCGVDDIQCRIDRIEESLQLLNAEAKVLQNSVFQALDKLTCDVREGVSGFRELIPVRGHPRGMTHVDQPVYSMDMIRILRASLSEILAEMMNETRNSIDNLTALAGSQVRSSSRRGSPPATPRSSGARSKMTVPSSAVHSRAELTTNWMRQLRRS